MTNKKDPTANERKKRQRQIDAEHGIKRYEVRCHQDDIKDVKRFAENKLRKRLT